MHIGCKVQCANFSPFWRANLNVVGAEYIECALHDDDGGWVGIVYEIAVNVQAVLGEFIVKQVNN
jgi:hypothetical protein